MDFGVYNAISLLNLPNDFGKIIWNMDLQYAGNGGENNGWKRLGTWISFRVKENGGFKQRHRYSLP